VILDLIAVAVLTIWLVVAALIAIPFCKLIHRADQHTPSPNHPAGRAHKTIHHTDGEPLNQWEAPRWEQIRQQLAQDEQTS
jgi:hypothetical protein